MTHFNIDYAKIQDRKAADEAAIKDIEEYVGKEKFKNLVDLAQLIIDGKTPVQRVERVNFVMGMFIGIIGFPFHAFCRRYMLSDYRAWLLNPPNPIETDEEGFQLNLI